MKEKERKREIFKNYKQEKKRVTYTNEERRKQQGERIGETGRDKVIESGRFSRYVKEGKKSLKYT